MQFESGDIIFIASPTYLPVTILLIDTASSIAGIDYPITTWFSTYYPSCICAATPSFVYWTVDYLKEHGTIASRLTPLEAELIGIKDWKVR